jgi:hypothetical protein
VSFFILSFFQYFDWYFKQYSAQTLSQLNSLRRLNLSENFVNGIPADFILYFFKQNNSSNSSQELYRNVLGIYPISRNLGVTICVWIYSLFLCINKLR